MFYCENRYPIDKKEKVENPYHIVKYGRWARKEYNSRDLMTKYWKVQNGNTQMTTYVYDVENLRVGKTENVNGVGTIMDVLKRFTYDGQNILSDGTAFYLNNIAVNTYEGEIYGDRNVAYLKDAIGTVRGELYDHPIVDKLTSVETSFKRFDYTAFGEQIVIEPTEAGSTDPNSTRIGTDSTDSRGSGNGGSLASGGVHEGIGFTGHYGDSESGLYYARARYLDPSVGRWLTRDSFEDYSPAGLNKYQDCNNNPVRFTDPLGMDPTDSNSSDNIFTTIGNFFGNLISGAVGFLTGVGEGIVGGCASIIGGITGNQSIIEAGNNILADAQKNISYSLYLAQHLSSSYQQNEQNYMIAYHTLPAGIIAGINENRARGLEMKPYEQIVYYEAMKNPGSNIGYKNGSLYTKTMDSEMNNLDNKIAYNYFGNGAVYENGMTLNDMLLNGFTKTGTDFDLFNGSLTPEEKVKMIWEKCKEDKDWSDKLKQEQYAKSNMDKNVITYEYDPVTEKVYKVNSDGTKVESNVGKDQLDHYKYQFGKYGDKVENIIKENGDYVIIGEEGLGKGMVTNRGKDVYDDRITVLMKENGKITIKEFNRANIDSTMHKFDPNAVPSLTDPVHKIYKSVAAGKYDLVVYQRPGQSDANKMFTLAVNAGKAVPAVEGGTMREILIHIGGPDWNYSEGCSTIYGGDYQNGSHLSGGDYDQFMGMFGYKDSQNVWQFNYNNPKQTSYYLFR
jgi:RHS repeat-associated protein